MKPARNRVRWAGGPAPAMTGIASVCCPSVVSGVPERRGSGNPRPRAAVRRSAGGSGRLPQVECRSAAGGLLIAVSGGASVVLWPVPVLVVVAAGVVGVAITRRWRWDRTLLPEVLALPTVAGVANINSRWAGIGLAAVVALSFRHRTQVRGFSAFLPLALFAAASLPVWVRPITLRSWLSVGVLIVAVNVARAGRSTHVVASVMDGVGLYLLADVVAYRLGLSPTGQVGRLNEARASGGPFADRVLYPLSPSGATPAILAAAFIVAAVLLMRANPERRLLRAALLPAAVVVILEANYRGPVVAVLAVLLLVALPRLRRLLPTAAIAVLLVPFYFGAVQGAVNATLSTTASAFPYLSRSPDVSLLSSRDIIWTSTLNHWQKLPSDRQLVGFGRDGNVTSGASSVYGSLFTGSVLDPALTSSHNTLLQQLYDAGLIGLGLLGAAMWITARRFVGTNRAGLGVVVLLLLTAATEVSLAPGAADVGLWVLMLLAAGALGGASGGSPPYSQRISRGPGRADDDKLDLHVRTSEVRTA